MEKIRIGTDEQLYEIKSIRSMSSNVMQIVFAGSVPITWGNITIYTEDGTEATTLTGYETVYRDEGQAVYLSNDGSVYQAPETPDGPGEPPEPYVPTLEELQAGKGTPEYGTLKSQYDGPDHGIDYHDETGKFTIAVGWHVDTSGNIVRD